MFDKTVSNKEKTKIQNKLLGEYKNSPNLLINWATGCGKTRAALLCINYSIKQDLNRKWFIICKEHTHINNWKEDIEKHGFSNLLKNITFFCYASLSKFFTETNIYGIILDECHGAGSNKRLEYLSKLNKNVKSIIALSASLPEDLYFKLKSNGIDLVKNKIALVEAINLNILPKPKIHIHKLYLDNRIRNQILVKTKGKNSNNIKSISTDYDNYRKKMTSLKKKKSYTLEISCTQQEKYIILSNDIEYYQLMYYKTKKDFYQYKMLALASKRKRFISSIKTNVLKNIIKNNSSKRKIIFTGSKEQSEEVCSNYIHSDLTKKEVINRINLFNSKKVNELSCVKMARESLNLVDIEIAIITQLDKAELYFIQMLGRSLRGVSPEAHLIVIPNTQDNKYLNSVLKNSKIPKDWIYET